MRLLSPFYLKSAIISIILLIFAAPGALAEGEQGAVDKFIPDNPKGIHAKPWVFGQSADREAPIWVKGKTGNSLVPKEKKSKPKAAAADERKSGVRSSLGLSLKEESATWKVTPSQKDTRTDELKLRENHHIVGAYADVEAGNDFNIRVGPELILKDESHGEESAYSSQPDSSWGLGMKFKYDF